jgi:hypothetical protein
MGFEFFCGTMIALLLGLAVCFAGYRFFIALLPIWGFFFGFGLGAQTLQALFGIGFLATITSWVIGFVVGALFAVLSYLFFVVGVALLAGSLGYALGVGFMNLIGIQMGFLSWLVGIVLAIVVIGVTLFFNIQKYVIIVATAVDGAALIIGTLLFGAAGLSLARLFTDPVRVALENSPLWTIFFLVLAGAGIVVQIMSTRYIELEPYENRI